MANGDEHGTILQWVGSGVAGILAALGVVQVKAASQGSTLKNHEKRLDSHAEDLKDIRERTTRIEERVDSIKADTRDLLSHARDGGG